MAYTLKELVWEDIYDEVNQGMRANCPFGYYTIERCLSADCVDETVYNWGFKFYNGSKGYFKAGETLENVLSIVDNHYGVQMAREFNEVEAYGAPYNAFLEITDINLVDENDTVAVVIEGVTYTFTADVNGEFGDYVATGGTADEDLQFMFSLDGLLVFSEVGEFTVTSYTSNIALRDPAVIEVTDEVVSEPTSL